MIGVIAFAYAAVGLGFAAYFWWREIPYSFRITEPVVRWVDAAFTVLFGAVYGVIWPVVLLAMLKG